VPIIGILFAALVGAVVLALFVYAAIAAIIIAAIVGIIWLIYYLYKRQRDEEHKRVTSENFQLKDREELRLLTQQASKTFPTAPVFIDGLTEALKTMVDTDVVPPEVFLELMRAFWNIYERELPKPPADATRASLQVAAHQAQNFDPVVLADVMLDVEIEVLLRTCDRRAKVGIGISDMDDRWVVAVDLDDRGRV
jgi:uncharacterized membrane protein YraQ (UPF0718 family)